MVRNRRTATAYTLILALAAAAMLVCGYNTSPLCRYLGVDSGMYLIIGRAMTRGTPLYTGLFDHKGPLIFLVNMLPQLLIKGTLGVWLTELGLLAGGAALLYRLAGRHVAGPVRFCVPIVYVWVTVTLFNGGNYTEEYANFFSVLGLCLFDKWLTERRLPPSSAFLLGVYSAAAFFFRPNNVALLAAMVLFMGVEMLRFGRRDIPRALLCGLLGIAAVTLPVVVYHLLAGTLYELLEATVLHNLRYCQTGTQSGLLPRGNAAQRLCFFGALGVLLAAMCSCYSAEDNRNGTFLLLGTVVTALMIAVGRRPFLYYWTLLAPLTAYAAMLLGQHGVSRRKRTLAAVSLLAVLLLCGLNGILAVKPGEKRQAAEAYRLSTQALAAQIPDGEEADCFTYDMPAMFLYETDLPLPCRYFSMQSWMAETNPEIARVCAGYLRDRAPKWVLSCYPLGSILQNKAVTNILQEAYQEVYANECGYLYRRADGQP